MTTGRIEVIKNDGGGQTVRAPLVAGIYTTGPWQVKVEHRWRRLAQVFLTWLVDVALFVGADIWWRHGGWYEPVVIFCYISIVGLVGVAFRALSLLRSKDAT